MLRFILRPPFARIMQGLTELTINAGKAAHVIHQYEPDLAFFDINAQIVHAEDRLPGGIKPSYKWVSTMRNASGSPYLQNKFKKC